MNLKFVIKCCMYALTMFVLLNFVGYTISNDFIKQTQVNSIDFSDDEAENGKESKEELKNLFFHVSFHPDFISFEQTLIKKNIPTKVELPMWHPLPETPPPDVNMLQA